MSIGSLVFVALGGISVAAYEFLPHTELQHISTGILQLMLKNKKVSVSPAMERIIQEAVADAKLSDDEIDRLRAYVHLPEEPYTWGSWDSSELVSIGYPECFHNFDKRDANLSEYQASWISEHRESPEAAEFQSTLLLSEKAKKFAIAREIFRAKNATFPVDATSALMYTFVIYIFSRQVNRVYGLFKAPLHYRVLSYTIIGAIFANLHFFFRDRRWRELDAKVDELACGLGVAYAEGGAEFYDKMCRRHAAERVLIPDMADTFNLKGDRVPSMFRRKFVPTSHRLEYCRQQAAAAASQPSPSC